MTRLSASQAMRRLAGFSGLLRRDLDILWRDVFSQPYVVAGDEELIPVGKHLFRVNSQDYRLAVPHRHLDHRLSVGRHVHVVAATLD